MAELRTTNRLDPALQHDCDAIHIDGYRLREVTLPEGLRQGGQRAVEIVIYGRNFQAVGQPLVARVGEVPVRFLRIAPDERSVEGLLLEEPEEGARVQVFLGDADAAQHAQAFDPSQIERIR
jgi:hypothetical protein